MILLISEIKKLLRSILPKWAFVTIYRIYKKIKKNKDVLTKKQQKQIHFTKKGVFKFSLDGTKFDIALDPDNGGVDSEIYADGVYEPEILKIIKKYSNSESIFIDIGANIGQHSLFASRFVKQVYAFEPIKKIFDQCNQSIQINNFTNISTYNYALGNEQKTLPIYGNVGNMGASSLVSTENRKKIQDIQVKRFDNITTELGIERIDFIKIDVEGYELDVLLGAYGSIKKYKPVLLIEYSPYFYNQIDETIGGKIIDYITTLGYTIYDINDGTSQKHLIQKNSDMDYVTQTNILCVYEKN